MFKQKITLVHTVTLICAISLLAACSAPPAPPPANPTKAAAAKVPTVTDRIVLAQQDYTAGGIKGSPWTIGGN